MKVLISNNIHTLKQFEIFRLAEFVVKENYKYHSENNLPDGYIDEVNSIFKEELEYFQNSQVFASKSQSGDILGSIRVLKWNYQDELPIQKIFAIKNIMLYKNDKFEGGIYHIGRLAIGKKVNSIVLFKKLLKVAISVICEEKGSIAFAECDVKLLRTLTFLGIKTRIIGKSKIYLGSETVPVLLDYETLFEYNKKNQAKLPYVSRKMA